MTMTEILEDLSQKGYLVVFSPTLVTWMQEKGLKYVVTIHNKDSHFNYYLSSYAYASSVSFEDALFKAFELLQNDCKQYRYR